VIIVRTSTEEEATMRNSRLSISFILVLVTAGFLACGDDSPVGVGESVTETLRLGPFTMSPGQEMEGYTTDIPRPSGDFGLQAVSFEVTDETGTPIEHHDFHLHHIVMHNGNRDDHACPGETERFIAAGQEKTPIGPFPDGYAYPIAAGDRLDAVYHLMDTRASGEGEMRVYIEYEMTYLPGASGYRPLTPYFLDVVGCGGNSTYDVPGNGGPGSEHVQTASWTCTKDGLVLWVAGHLHEGGKRLTLTNETRDDLICQADLTYDEQGELSMSSCAPLMEIRQGDICTLESVYDNSHYWEDAMGIVLAYIWESSETGDE
jgi:hypothetical protein